MGVLLFRVGGAIATSLVGFLLGLEVLPLLVGYFGILALVDCCNYK